MKSQGVHHTCDVCDILQGEILCTAPEARVAAACCALEASGGRTKSLIAAKPPKWRAQAAAAVYLSRGEKQQR
jgi:hypothetical protein